MLSVTQQEVRGEVNHRKEAKKCVDLAVAQDSYLEYFKGHLEARQEHYLRAVDKINTWSESLDAFTKGYQRMGFNETATEIIYREWAPGAEEAFLIGDFNEWNRQQYPMQRDEYGVWSVTLPSGLIKAGTRVKITMRRGEKWFDRIPAWISRAEYDPNTNLYEAVYIPKKPYDFKSQKPVVPRSLKIYEAHVGITSAEGKVATYREFTRDVIPRVKRLGYNCIQLMAIMEHAYYGSFGYQVTSFFAPSSRYGSIDELKELIDAAHAEGILVFLDIVHSHACKNVLDGLNEFDGTESCYFHSGDRGRHDLWDSRLFDYGQPEVLRFLLSNLRWWLEEFQFDGFRFDGVTSMLYYHHGIAYGFSGDYREYFGSSVDWDAVVYLQLANKLVHMLRSVSIAEDVSGMPLLCRPLEECGLGFDYRLNMAIPDLWIRMLKEQRDEEWSMGHLVHTLTNRRWGERTIGYAESHDQALVGDKTIAFWLMDAAMYTDMTTLWGPTPVIDRGIALHKMIRLITFALGGESWLCFMGNEFGHPEWLDFPRQGNNYSYHYARRQFHLAAGPNLRYKHLEAFDVAMMKEFENEFENDFFDLPIYISRKHEADKVIAFERGPFLFIFNFHPTQSYVGYRVGYNTPGAILSLGFTSDAEEFGGWGRIDRSVTYACQGMPWDHRKDSIQVYLPSRTCLVLHSL